MRVISRCLVVVLIGSSLAVATPASAYRLPKQVEAGPVEYFHPVQAEIIKGFQAPVTPYGPGHRGLKYVTQPGSKVGAAAEGEVIFAGQVAGSLHVTIRHPDGRLSSYSYLNTVLVHMGQVVASGETIATTHEILHVSVREGGEYIDPELVFGSFVYGAVLVPENEPGGVLWGAAHEATELAMATMFDGSGFSLSSLWGPAWAGASGFASAVYGMAPTVLALAQQFGPWIHEALLEPATSALAAGIVTALVIGLGPELYTFLADHSAVHQFVSIYRNTLEWWQSRRDCTPASTVPEPPTERRLAVLVDGFTSTSASNTIAKLPLENLGYELSDVLRFSYEGGRTPTFSQQNPTLVSPELQTIPANDYNSLSSATDLASKGNLLAELLTQAAVKTPPEVPLDIYAHSQGGVVLRLALTELQQTPEGRETLARLGLLTTIDSPHQGADIAAMASILSTNVFTGSVVSVIGGDNLDPSHSTNIIELSSSSDFMEELDQHELPLGPQYLALGAAADLTVTANHARLEGATNVTIDAGYLNPHSSVIEHTSTEREISLALARLAPTCVAFLSFIKNLVVTTGVEVALSSVVVGAGIAARPFTLAETTTKGILALT